MIPTPRLLATAAALAALALPAAAQQPIKIGFMAELSGPQGALGQDQYDAFMLIVEQNGGKLGGVPVQVLREDSQLKPEVAVQIVDKLIERERVPIITGVTFSNVMMAVHKKVTDKEVFLIGSNAGPSPIAGAQCSPYYFSTSWQNDQQAEVVGQYAKDKGYGKVVTIAPNYQSGKDHVAGFKRKYTGQVLQELYPALNTQDFSAEIAQIAAAQPQAVFAFLPGGLGINFVKQWAQAGMKSKIPLLSTSTTDGIGLPAMGDAATGLISGTFWGPDLTNPANQKFVKDFEAKYKRIPSQYAAQAYDSALLLDSAIRKVNGKIDDKKAFGAALKAADFKSVRGNFKFNNNQFPVQDWHMFEAVKDGQGRLTLKTIATPVKAGVDAFHSQCSLK
ncbi:MAG: ABC transporter substrate-binding protein [Burkholderiales bacterium]|nr:ABC transporter substrate-binding protein [Burkholderiales bacterium]ODU69252.1 MAG: ABC transporter substrate-binding protein [Lautropia sp. SCN 66-9]